MEIARLQAVVSADVSDFERGMRQVEQRAQGLGGTLKSIATQAAGFAAGMAAVSGLSSAFDAVKDAVFGFNSQLQSAQIAFTTMLGSGERAAAFLNELKRFARETPFEFPDLVQASQRLMAMGIQAKDVIPTLTAIGDAVAALGGSSALVDRVTLALGQMQAKGKVSAEEMLQLTEAGIPAWDILAKKLGVTVPEAMKMAEKGAISANTAIEALRSGMEERFGGMMEQQSKTLAGALSNVKDSFSQLAATAGKPIFDLAAQGALKLADILGRPEWQQFAQTIANGIAAAFEQIGNLASRLSGPLQEGLSLVQTVASQIKSALTGLFEDLGGAGGGEGMFSGMTQALEHLKSAVQSALDGIRSFWESHREQIAQIVDGIADSVAKAFSGIANEIGPTLDAVVSIIERVVGEIRERWSMIEDILGPVFEGTVANVRSALDALSNTVQLVMNVIQGDWSGAWENIKNIARDAWNIITTDVKVFAEAIPAALRLAWSVLGDVAEGAWNLVKAAVEAAWNGIKAAVTAGAGEVLSFLQSLPGQMVSALGNLSGLLVQAGRDLIQGFINGITSMAGAVLSAITSAITDKIPGFIKDKLGIRSPSTLMAEIGKEIPAGLAEGISENSDVVREAMETVVRAMEHSVDDIKDVRDQIADILARIADDFSLLPPSVQEAIQEIVATLDAGAADAAEALGKLLAALEQAKAAAKTIQSVGGGGGGGGGRSSGGGSGGSGATGVGRPAAGPDTEVEEVAPGLYKITYRDPSMPPGTPPIVSYTWDPGLLEKIYGPGPITEDKIRDYIKYYGGKKYAAGGLLTEPVVGVGLRTRTLYQLGEQGPEWVVPDRSLLPLVRGVMAGASFALAPLAEKLRSALAPVQQAAVQAAQAAQAVQTEVKQALPVVDSLDQVKALAAQVRGDSPFVTISVLTGPPGENQSWYNLIFAGGQLYAAGTVREQADAVVGILKATGLAEGNRSFPGLSVIARNADWVQSLPPYPGTSGATQVVAEQGRVVRGLARGGLLTEPVVGVGLRTGATYQLAEREPEWVVPASAREAGQRGGPTSGPIIIQRFEGEAKPDVVRRAVRDALWLSGMPGVTTP